MSKQYVIGWKMPFRSQSQEAKFAGNVCIVEHTQGASMPSACADVPLFPHIYQSIGVNEERLSMWQNKHGFDSGGVGSRGELLVPEYPIFSRLAWTVIDPVYLKDGELSDLIDESKRISEQSSDPVVRANLGKLSTIAQKAQAESKVLRIS
jgi:hypothetical protein